MTDIRILVTGSRLWQDAALLTDALDEAAAGHDYVTLIHGRCDPRLPNGNWVSWDKADPYGVHLGADWMAHQHAVRRGWAVDAVAAEWNLYGNAAGRIRNQKMANLLPVADVCVAAPFGKSPGTRDCIRRAKAAGIRVVDVTEPPEPEGLW